MKTKKDWNSEDFFGDVPPPTDEDVPFDAQSENFADADLNFVLHDEASEWLALEAESAWVSGDALLAERPATEARATQLEVTTPKTSGLEPPTPEESEPKVKLEAEDATSEKSLFDQIPSVTEASAMLLGDCAVASQRHVETADAESAAPSVATMPPTGFDVRTAPLTVPTLLEASAGTGKTFSIKHLVLRLVVEEDMPIDTLLVMSFTRAATAELSARIKHHLGEMYGFLTGSIGEDEVDGLLLEQCGLWEARRKAAEEANREDEAAFFEPQAIAARIKRSLTRFDKAAIYTIHSFAQKTLTAFAFSSGASLDWTLSDDDTAICQDVVEDFLRRELDRYADSPALRERLVSGDGWAQKLKALAQHPESLVPRVILTSDVGEVASQGTAEGEETEASAAARTPDPIDETLTRFVEEAPRAFEAKKAQAGVVTFDDLLVGLWEKLRTDETGRLAKTIRDAYRGVLIDEFQDTDPLQFAIFRKLFMEGVTREEQKTRALFFVGDPKQAIYRFRSADLNTYLYAGRLIDTIGMRAQLTRNFRSSPALVEAFNRFFSKAPVDSSGPFLRPELGYTQVAASRAKTGLFRRERGVWREAVPLEIWGSFGSPLLNADARRALTAEAIANDIAGLIAAGMKGQAAVARDADDTAAEVGRAKTSAGETVSLRALEARDIAVLVRRRKEIDPIRDALLSRGVRLRMRSQMDVCETPEAADLLLVLRAFNAPGDERVLRAARASRFMGESLSKITADDEAERVALRALFEAGAKKWRRSGVASAFADLMQTTELERRLLKVRGGERMLANYAHLIEVLHEAGRSHPTPAGLIAWFELAMAGKASDEGEKRKLRLESDANVVTGETIHSSKGLQYPIVYVPNGEDFGDGKPEKAAVRRVHVEQSVAQSGMVLELSHTETSAPESEKAESREEMLRLAYVAMTRAAKRLVICVPQMATSKQKSTIWRSTTIKNAFFRILAGNDDPGKQADVIAQLEALNDERTIRLRDIAEVSEKPIIRLRDAVLEAQADLAIAPAKDRYARWRTSSFTAISRMQDEEAEGTVAPYFGVKRRKTPRGDILSFPRGAQAGTCLHAMLEEADFAAFSRSDAEAEREAFARRIIERHLSFPTDAAKEEAVRGASQMLFDVLNAELAPGLRLRNVPAEMRFAELEFLLSLPSGLTADVLGDALGELDPKYAVPGLSREKLTGFLTGFIDLAIAADGRFWVIDWKSNAISDAAEGYDTPAMAAEMTKHSYRLQYLIYLVALKRFLKARLGRRFDMSMIGGAIYVFLRGVRADRTTAVNPQGVVFDPVNPLVIDALDEFFSSGYSPRRLAAAKAVMQSQTEEASKP